MAPKLVTVLLLFFLVAAVPWAQSSEADNWATSKKFPKKTVTKLQFYFHDTISGKNPSAIRVAQAAGTQKSPTLFGLVMMADDPLTKTADPNSELVGRAQGLYGSAGQQELGLIMAMNYGFTHGIYNGSSVSLLGKNPATHPVREMAIVGGTGLFRFARGYAIAQTHWFDANTGDAIVGYNVTVVH
ncbi:hypothetical protein I3843_06G118500 [Carya illinoinensis]|uniref:Dirigent protein n=1 Tax=Carya illinoinensis TaxID=32201 RepID=A0A8T1QB62_CARIL|nr:dirigent protein 23-like [Carya illinoinensis]KAG2703186.1 hypothetical protein I3760_06G126300 [Carya illinoinensis]KAG6619808.1 hypothetical protein I3842_Q080700 [Carya illinoinensis]KAG6651605.1 hypothetical protein CIPAW_06G124500 [Carya illinoinensis]KAG6709277.1 hypothetical protein I3842_06G124500 [Carya illinoinensis]KAG7975807.1 hypothetical protein I3843_06G118500 [Carya illinoinensis]